MIVRSIPSLVFPQRRRTILLLLGEKAGMRADVKQICCACGWCCAHTTARLVQRYFASNGASSCFVFAGQNFLSVRIAFFNAEWHGQFGSAGICGMAPPTICFAMSAMRISL